MPASEVLICQVALGNLSKPLGAIFDEYDALWFRLTGDHTFKLPRQCGENNEA
jgi:hypothetical protein